MQYDILYMDILTLFKWPLCDDDDHYNAVYIHAYFIIH